MSKTYSEKDIKQILNKVENIRDTFIEGINAQIKKLKNLLDEKELCSYYFVNYGTERCMGTQHTEMCSCKGNKDKCDFYVGDKG